MVLLPLLTFVLIFVAIRLRLASRRMVFVVAAIAWGVCVTAITEALSVWHTLDTESVAVAWALLALGTGVAVVRSGIAGIKAQAGRIAVRQHCRSIDGFSTLIVASLLAMWLTTGLVALVAPPNYWDSLTYHMSRVAHWAQDRSVAPFPTAILRQLHSNPWAEFAILQLQVLSGGDRFANLVQWFSLAGTALVGSLIAQLLGAGRPVQLFASLVSGTVPMGLLEASSAENDYVVGFWMVCLVALVLYARAGGNGSRLMGIAVLGGCAVGMAVLTKATAYIYAAPFVVWIALWIARTHRWRGGAALLLAAACALLLNAGQYARNVAVYGSPLGPGDEGGPGLQYTNAAFSAPILVSNILRNAALEVATPSAAVNSALEFAVVGVHRIIGVDPDDPSTTWAGTSFHIPLLRPQEDASGNPLHFLLFMLALVLALTWWRTMDRRVVEYAVALGGAALLFVVLLRWQPWHSRLHLPLLLLSAPLVAVILSRAMHPLAIRGLSVLLVVMATPWLLLNANRPVVGSHSILRAERDALYFAARPELFPSYESAVATVNAAACGRVGLLEGGNDWEYPLWVLFAEGRPAPVRIEAVGVSNVSVRTAGEAYLAFVPCALVSLSGAHVESFNVGQQTFRPVWSDGGVLVFLPVR